MSIKRLLLGMGSLLLLAGTLLACFVRGGWLRHHGGVYEGPDALAELSLRLGFFPDRNTVLPLLGLGLMVAGTAVVVVGWSVRSGSPSAEPDVISGLESRVARLEAQVAAVQQRQAEPGAAADPAS